MVSSETLGGNKQKQAGLDVRDPFGDDPVAELRKKIKQAKKKQEQDMNTKKKQSHDDEPQPEGIITSRKFALSLIGIASLYILIMICQASRNNLNQINMSATMNEYGSEYYTYETESYDFQQYQSQGSSYYRMQTRGFKYNESIGGSVQNDTSRLAESQANA